MKRRNIVGDVINYKGLIYGPVNENGVIFLFSKISEEVGINVENIRAGFPDCIARKNIAPGRWEEVKIEFEFKSSDFKRHGHNPDDCDMIVCWQHDWQQTPKNLEVFELKKFVEEKTGRQIRTSSMRSREAAPAKVKHYFDTIVCPARKEGFERVFLGKNSWWAIRLRKKKHS